MGARYHAVTEEGLTLRNIAEVIGRRLNVPVVAKSPEEAADHTAPNFTNWNDFRVGI